MLVYYFGILSNATAVAVQGDFTAQSDPALANLWKQFQYPPPNNCLLGIPIIRS